MKAPPRAVWAFLGGLDDNKASVQNDPKPTERQTGTSNSAPPLLGEGVAIPHAAEIYPAGLNSCQLKMPLPSGSKPRLKSET